MRKQIAAANWKMNLTYQQGTALLQTIVSADIYLKRKSCQPFLRFHFLIWKWPSILFSIKKIILFLPRIVLTKNRALIPAKFLRRC